VHGYRDENQVITQPRSPGARLRFTIIGVTDTVPDVSTAPRHPGCSARCDTAELVAHDEAMKLRATLESLHS
jgi:hypothetical protein